MGRSQPIDRLRHSRLGARKVCTVADLRDRPQASPIRLVAGVNHTMRLHAILEFAPIQQMSNYGNHCIFCQDHLTLL
jgi:hypothetical protein